VALLDNQDFKEHLDLQEILDLLAHLDHQVVPVWQDQKEILDQQVKLVLKDQQDNQDYQELLVNLVHLV
jgi:hypothetical protein